MVYGLEVVAVGIQHKGRVIVRVVARAQARSAIVVSADCERGGVERIDRCPIRCSQSEMQRRPRLALSDPQILTSLGPIAEGAAHLDLPCPPGGQRGHVEASTCREISNVERHVIEEPKPSVHDPHSTGEKARNSEALAASPR